MSYASDCDVDLIVQLAALKGNLLIAVGIAVQVGYLLFVSVMHSLR